MTTVTRRLVAALLALGACSQAAPPPPKPSVVVATVEARDFPVWSEWLGTTQGEVDAEIRAQVSGYLVSRDYNEGQLVKKGDLLFRIDPAPFKAALGEAQGRLGSVQARLERARLDVARYEPLVKEGAVSRQEYDNAVQRERAVRAELDSARAAVDKAKIDLAFTEIRSPVDGVAGIADAQIGDLVGSIGAPLAMVSQLDPILVSFPVSEQEYLRSASQIGQAMKDGQFATRGELILADGSVYPHQGVAYPAGGGVDPRTGTITVKARFPNPDLLLRAGQYARIRAETQLLKGALVVPQRAIIDLQGQKQLAVVTPEDKIEVRAVKLGPASGTDQVVESGVTAGERVVVEGFQKVRPGMVVAVAAPPAPDVATPPPGSSEKN